jgi:hypothetical protein
MKFRLNFKIVFILNSFSLIANPSMMDKLEALVIFSIACLVRYAF